MANDVIEKSADQENSFNIKALSSVSTNEDSTQQPSKISPHKKNAAEGESSQAILEYDDSL